MINQNDIFMDTFINHWKLRIFNPPLPKKMYHRFGPIPHISNIGRASDPTGPTRRRRQSSTIFHINIIRPEKKKKNEKKKKHRMGPPFDSVQLVYKWLV